MDRMTLQFPLSESTSKVLHVNAIKALDGGAWSTSRTGSITPGYELGLTG